MIDPIEIADMINEFGEGKEGVFTLQRYTGPNRINRDVDVVGVVRQYKPADLVGGIKQGDCQIIISNVEIEAAAWPGPPRKNDGVIRGTTLLFVESVETRKIGDAVAMHILQCRGKQ